MIQCLLEKQSEAYEGSHLEMAVHKLASLCIKESAVKGITPSAIAAIGSKCMHFWTQRKVEREFRFLFEFFDFSNRGTVESSRFLNQSNR